MNNFILDSNIIIRFLTKDDEVQSPSAFKLFEKAAYEDGRLIISPLIIAECTWVLEMKRYGYSKIEIASILRQLIIAPGIQMLQENITLRALKDYCNHNVDFMDAYLASLSSMEVSHPIVTWNDKDFKRLGCEYYLPEEVI